MNYVTKTTKYLFCDEGFEVDGIKQFENIRRGFKLFVMQMVEVPEIACIAVCVRLDNSEYSICSVDAGFVSIPFNESVTIDSSLAVKF